MTTNADIQLRLYNGALMELGERSLAALTDNVEPRRLLDRVWADGAVNDCLSNGQWRFARRTLALQYDEYVTASILHGVIAWTDPIRDDGTAPGRCFTINISGTWAGTITLQYSLDQSSWTDVGTYTANTVATVAYGQFGQTAYYRIGVKAANSTGSITSGTVLVSLGIQQRAGYTYNFTIPADFEKTVSLCSDPIQTAPLLQYTMEAGHWYANISPIYVTYISHDTAYGGNMVAWQTDFCRYVECYLATRIVKKLTQNTEEWKRLFTLLARLEKEARSADAEEFPTRFLPPGSFVQARAVGNRGTYRFNRSQFYG